MRKLFLSILVIGATLNLSAQDGVRDMANASGTSPKGNITTGKWSTGGVFALSASQVGNHNWQAANPDNKYTIAGNATLNAYANRKFGKFSLSNNIDAIFGSIVTKTEGQRKLSDRIELNSKLGWKPKGWCCNGLSAAILGQARTQFANGYDYNYMGTGVKRRTSGFFAPATITVAPGIDYQTKNNKFSVFASPVAARWVIVTNAPYSYAAQGGIYNGNVEKPLASFYGVNPAKEHRGELGYFISARAQTMLFDKIKYIGRLDIYGDYTRGNPGTADVFQTNAFLFPVTKHLALTFNLDFLYDDDARDKNGGKPGLQSLSIFGVGYTKSL